MSALLPTIFAVYPIALGAIGVAWLIGARAERRMDWCVEVLVAGSIVVFVFLSGPWMFTSHYLRYVLLAVFGYAVVHSYLRLNTAVGSRSTARLRVRLPVLLLFVLLDALLIGSLFSGRNEESVAVSFPLTSGVFCVLQGGRSVITNPFHALSGNRLALDIVELNRLGNRASGIAPGSLDSYEIFGDSLFSPCDGTVVTLRDDLPDNPPGQPDATHSRGNHVVLKCDDAEVTLAHLMQGSIGVSAGETIRTGRLIGLVGNSGNTLEPHLHIAAQRNGRNVMLRFDGRSLSVNDVVKVR